MRPAGILAYGAVSVLAYKLGLLVTEELKNREIREELRRLKSLPDDASAARVPRILLLYSDVGNGHQRAAEAVEEALHWQGAVEFEGGVITQATDILSFAPSDARSVYQSAYQSFVRSGGADRGYGSSRKDASHALQAATRKVMAQSLILKVVRLLHEFRPHVIINTHFLPAEVVAELASRYGLTTPQLTVITDFDVARSWVHEPTSHYFVAREEAGKVLEHFGVRSARITVSGVPIMPDYEDVAKKRRAAVMADLELGVLLDVRAAGASLTSPSREDLKPIVVIEPTGRAMKEVLKHTLETHHPLEVVALVGSTAQSRGDLAGLRVPLQHTLHLRAATKRLPELLRIASLYVGKPSTLSVAECLALGTPMALVEPCAGQEARNGDMLLMAGAAIRVHEPCLLPFSVDALLENGGGRLRELRERCRLMGRPRASAIIAAHALALSSLPLPRRRSSQLPLDVLQPPRESNRSLVLSPPRTPRSGDGDADGSSRRSGRMDPVRTKAAAVAEPQMASPQFRVPTASRHQPKRTAGAAADGPGAPGMLMGNGEHGLSPGLRMHGGAGSGLVFPVLPSLFVSSPLRDTTISTSPLTMVEGNSFDDPTCVSPSDMTADFTHNATLCELLEGMPLAGPGASGRGSMPLNDNLFTYR